MRRAQVGVGELVPAVGALLCRPDLWAAAVAVAWRLAPSAWWRRWPFLPLPDAELWAFRMVTAYGAPDARPRAVDAVAFVEWCRAGARRRPVRTCRRPPAG